MKMVGFGGLLGSVAFSIALSGCGAAGNDGERDQSENIGEATAEIRLAPPDTRCVVLKTVGSSTVSQQFKVASGSSTVLALTGLPLGSDTITAQAFNVACTSVTATTAATYVSDPVVVTVTAATPVNVSFQMRPAGTTGAGSATIDFPNAHVATEFTLPAGANNAWAITSGPDNNVWFTEFDQHSIGSMTPSGALTTFNVPTTAEALLAGITAGPDGNVWFAEAQAKKIGRITTSGVVSEFNVSGSPNYVTTGPDGNVWFTESGFVGRITPTGTLTEFPSMGFSSGGIVTGGDGNLWFTTQEQDSINKITPAGVLTRFPLTFPTQAFAIALGADGNVWVTMGTETGAAVGRVTTAGVLTQFPTTGINQISGIARGIDGNLWFGFPGGLGRITTAGVIAKVGIPHGNASVTALTAGPDGNLWFIESGGIIGKYAP